MAMERDNRAPRGRKRRKVCAFCVDKVETIRTLPSCAGSLLSGPRSCPAAPPAPAPCISAS